MHCSRSKRKYRRAATLSIPSSQPLPTPVSQPPTCTSCPGGRSFRLNKENENETIAGRAQVSNPAFSFPLAQTPPPQFLPTTCFLLTLAWLVKGECLKVEFGEMQSREKMEYTTTAPPTRDSEYEFNSFQLHRTTT